MASRITDDLREFVDKYLLHNTTADMEQWLGMVGRDIIRLADDIDAKHKTRMEDCRREVRRATVRYIRGVLTDYGRGVKRVRKGSPEDGNEIVWCSECEHMVFTTAGTICELMPAPYNYVDLDSYCSRGARCDEMGIEVDHDCR